ncbi:MAG: 4-(cytidine 5'-diphospho)-2-C-methyl-D-erythritol kinase, partial [Desulfobacteraceae bacterium]
MRIDNLRPKRSITNNQSSITNHQFHAPAKLNTLLKVIGRRADGYHELVSIMVPVGLFDHLEVALVRQRRIFFSSKGLPVPTSEENLIYRAARAFLFRTGLTHGVSIKLTKNIPVAAGLGGGSSDAAATLKAMNEMWSNPLTFNELSDLAVGLGADVPFFLLNKPCIARGIGEILEPIGKWPKFWYVIVSPPLEVSTAWVYRNLKLKLTRVTHSYNIDCLKKRCHNVDHLLENDLESVTASRFPIIDNIKDALLNEGSVGALMSGSGPSVFGIFRSKDQALLAKRNLISRNLG